MFSRSQGTGGDEPVRRRQFLLQTKNARKTASFGDFSLPAPTGSAILKELQRGAPPSLQTYSVGDM
jgi:hypothetical protein